MRLVNTTIHNSLIFNAIFAFSSLFGENTPEESAPAVKLDIDTAFQKVLERSIELRMSDKAIQITEAERLQASRYPNPDLSVSMDSCGGSGRYNNVESGDATITITQEFELGGKRSARMRFASMAQCVAYWDYEILKLDMYTFLVNAFIDVISAQEKLKIAEEAKKLADESHACVIEKVSSGKLSPQQQTKAKIDCSTAERALSKAKSNLRSAKGKLAALWESHNPDFDAVEYPLFEPTQLPPLEVLIQRLDQTPDIARERANIDLAWENIAIARANRIPSLDVSTGLSAYDKEGVSFFLGFDAVIPVFDRNQGNICAAYLQKDQAEFKEHDLKHHTQVKLATLYAESQSAYEEAIALKDVVLSATQESLKTTEESYHEGKSEYKDVLDAKKSLLDVRDLYIDALSDYHHKKADIDRLTTVTNDECE